MVTFYTYGQSNCEDANAYLVNAYSHVKDAYESNNISHLKYYANRSVESFKLSKASLIACNCENALNSANKGIELLTKVETAKTFEDGRFFVKRAKAISKESVIKIDECAFAVYNTNNNTTNINNEQQQVLTQEEQEALQLKKEQLITTYNHALTSNIKAYNEVLNLCNCNYETINDFSNIEDVSTKSIEQIKSFYKNNFKRLASNYLKALNSCQ